MRLTENGRVAVIGGGPAGSLAGYFLLEMADRIELSIQVDLYEPRDFTRTGPPGCNMCAGVVSESLVQTLAAEGINLPPMVVQRGIEAYILHTSGQPSVAIATPANDLRIATVYRGSGPRVSPEGILWSSFDGFLLEMAVKRGVRHIRNRVTAIEWDGDRPHLRCASGNLATTYDLVIGASGVNTPTIKLFEELGLDFKPPPVSKGYLSEIYLGVELTQKYLGSSMHIFLLEIPGLKFAALIPKVENVTVCLLGDNIDKDLVRRFMTSPEVQSCFPPGWMWNEEICRCMPKLNLGLAQNPFGNRVVLIGDAAISRLYKDGIGAAYITAKAAVVSSIFFGIAAEDFRDHYLPVCRQIEEDNKIGKAVFAITALYQKWPILRRSMVLMVTAEHDMANEKRAMSRILWDTFTGSSSYREILLRAFHPLFMLRWAWATTRALLSFLADKLLPWRKG